MQQAYPVNVMSAAPEPEKHSFAGSLARIATGSIGTALLASAAGAAFAAGSVTAVNEFAQSDMMQGISTGTHNAWLDLTNDMSGNMPSSMAEAAPQGDAGVMAQSLRESLVRDLSLKEISAPALSESAENIRQLGILDTKLHDFHQHGSGVSLSQGALAGGLTGAASGAVIGGFAKTIGETTAWQDRIRAEREHAAANHALGA